MAAVRAHPAFDPLLGVVDLHDTGQDIGDQAVVVAALAIIPGQGVAQLLLVVEQGALELIQMGSTFTQARHGIGLTGLSEPGQLVW